MTGKFKKGVGYVLVGIAYPIMGILGLVIHIWTIVIAFTTSGLVSAVISLMLPVVAQIYWFIKVWSIAETVLNQYCLAILVYVGCWIVIIIGMRMVDSSSS